MGEGSASPPPDGEIIFCEAPDGEVRVDVRFDPDTVWLTRQQMAEMFGRDRSVVARHIRDAFEEGELDPGQPVQNMHKFDPRADGRSRGNRTATTSTRSSLSATG